MLVSDPDMNHGTCVTHMLWCMSGSLPRGDGENVPGIHGACATIFWRIWKNTHGHWSSWGLHYMCNAVDAIDLSLQIKSTCNSLYCTSFSILYRALIGDNKNIRGSYIYINSWDGLVESSFWELCYIECSHTCNYVLHGCHKHAYILFSSSWWQESYRFNNINWNMTVYQDNFTGCCLVSYIGIP